MIRNTTCRLRNFVIIHCGKAQFSFCMIKHLRFQASASLSIDMIRKYVLRSISPTGSPILQTKSTNGWHGPGYYYRSNYWHRTPMIALVGNLRKGKDVVAITSTSSPFPKRPQCMMPTCKNIKGQL